MRKRMRAERRPDVNIFEYTDYRKFLKDYYQEYKRLNHGFSYERFASRCGFKSRSSICRFITGYRDLARKKILAIAQTMKLKKRETQYFLALVSFNKAKTIIEREYFFNQLRSFVRRSEIMAIKQNQFAYFSKWYHAVIRELLCIHDFKGSYAKLAGMLVLPITTRQARKSVELLCTLGLVKKLPSGRYAHSGKRVTSGEPPDKFTTLSVQSYQKTNIRLAGEAFDRFKPEERDISTLTVATSLEGVASLKQEIQGFRRRLWDIAQENGGRDRVVQINFQLFPLTKQPKPIKKRKPRKQ